MLTKLYVFDKKSKIKCYNFKATVFYFLNVFFFSSSMSHDLSEIFLACWFGAFVTVQVFTVIVLWM